MSSSSDFVATRGDLRREIVGQFALRADRLQDRGAARIEFADIDEPFRQKPQLRVVEPAGGFFAIARDERHRRAFVEQLDRRGGLLQPGPNFGERSLRRCVSGRRSLHSQNHRSGRDHSFGRVRTPVVARALRGSPSRRMTASARSPTARTTRTAGGGATGPVV